MRDFVKRRRRNIAIFVIVSVALVLADLFTSLTLHRSPIVSGWLLLALVVWLTLYNVRKKLAFLPLGSSAAWLQVHIYVGLLTAVVFALHVGWHVPNGIFEGTLAALYLAVFASGVLGLAASRIFAGRMMTRGMEILYERIPRYRNQIQRDVERLVMDCLAETDSTALPEFYTDRLKPFLERPSNFWRHLLHSDRPRRRLLGDIRMYHRYLNATERQFMDRIEQRVQAKDDLDYQHSHQRVLKYWLFVHVPLTYALLVFAVFHAVLVYAFSGGLR